MHEAFYFEKSDCCLKKSKVDRRLPYKNKGTRIGIVKNVEMIDAFNIPKRKV